MVVLRVAAYPLTTFTINRAPNALRSVWAPFDMTRHKKNEHCERLDDEAMEALFE